MGGKKERGGEYDAADGGEGDLEEPGEPEIILFFSSFLLEARKQWCDSTATRRTVRKSPEEKGVNAQNIGQ